MQPVWLVNQAAQFVLEQERQRINTESVAVSKFAAALFNSLNTKKSKSSEIEFSLFLPFKWDAKGGKAKLTTESAIVLQRLLAQNRIPRRVIGALGAVGILQESAELLKQK